MKRLYPSLFLFIFLGCIKSEKADLVVHNANIYTFNQQDEIFEAMAIADGKIIELGTEHQIMNRYLATEYFDAKKKIVLPAFSDPGILLDTNLSFGFTDGLTFSNNPNSNLQKVLKVNLTNFDSLKQNLIDDEIFGIYLDTMNLKLTSAEAEESFFMMLEFLKSQNLVFCIEAKTINKYPVTIDLISQVLKGYNDFRWRIENAHLLNPEFLPLLKGINLIPIIPIDEKKNNLPIISSIKANTGILGFGNYSPNAIYMVNSKNNLINQSRENALVLKKENQIGILEKGLNANFIIYKSNPFDTANNKIDKTNYIFFILGTEKNNLYPTN